MNGVSDDGSGDDSSSFDTSSSDGSGDSGGGDSSGGDSSGGGGIGDTLSGAEGQASSALGSAQSALGSVQGTASGILGGAQSALGSLPGGIGSGAASALGSVGGAIGSIGGAVQGALGAVGSALGGGGSPRTPIAPTAPATAPAPAPAPVYPPPTSRAAPCGGHGALAARRCHLLQLGLPQNTSSAALVTISQMHQVLANAAANGDPNAKAFMQGTIASALAGHPAGIANLAVLTLAQRLQTMAQYVAKYVGHGDANLIVRGAPVAMGQGLYDATLPAALEHTVSAMIASNQDPTQLRALARALDPRAQQ